MSIGLDFHIDVDDWADMATLLSSLSARYSEVSVVITNDGHVESPIDFSAELGVDDDDITAEDVEDLLANNEPLGDRVKLIASEHGITTEVALQAMRHMIADARDDERPVEDLRRDEAVRAETHRLRVAKKAGVTTRTRIKGTGRINPKDKGPHAMRIKHQVIDMVPCPDCGQPAGETCKSRSSGYDYGTGLVHGARINVWYDAYDPQASQ